MDGKVTWEEYYVYSWQVECDVLGKLDFEKECEEYREKCQDYARKVMGMERKVEAVMKVYDEREVKQMEYEEGFKKQEQEWKKQEQEWRDYTDRIGTAYDNLRRKYSMLKKECRKSKDMVCLEDGNFVCREKDSEQANKEVQMDKGMNRERDSEVIEEIDMDRTIKPGMSTEDTDRGSLDWMRKLEDEIARMTNAVALFAESLQRERLTGEMTSIRKCVHTQCRIGGGIPFTSEEEEETGAPQMILPSAECGPQQGG